MDDGRELQRLWLIEAVKYNVVPLDDRFADRSNPELAGRPELITGTRQVFHSGIARLSESSVINTHNKSFSITAEGVILAMGGVTRGMSLYAKGGRPKFCYSFFGLDQWYTDSSQELAPGTHQVRVEFLYDGGGLAKGGTVTLVIDGELVGSGRVERTHPFPFSGDEPLDLGTENGSPVTRDYGQLKFSGQVN